MRKTSLPVLALASAATLAATLAAGSSGYHLVRTLATSGDGGWDYLTFDAGTQRLFVTRGSRVDVVDPKSGKVLGAVPDTADVHGVALDSGLVFASNSDGTLTVVKRDGEKYAVLENVSTQRSARTIAVDPATHEVFLPAARFGPPPSPTPDRPHPRGEMEKGSFAVLVVGK